MAVIRRIDEATLHGISGCKPKTMNKGNGRRLWALSQKHPEIQIADTVDVANYADYEVDVSWGRLIYNNDQGEFEDLDPRAWDSKITNDISNNDTMIFLGSSNGINRPTQSKIMIPKGVSEAYAILTWTDLFGHSIKESPLGRKSKHDSSWILYATKLTEQELAEIHEAFTVAGIDF